MTPRQKIWLDAYFSDEAFLNASAAARIAGYKHPRDAGYENRTNPYIKKEIEARLTEISVGREEALIILSDHARGDIDDYLDDDGHFDLKKARTAKKTKLIKKLKVKRRIERKRKSIYASPDPNNESEDSEREILEETVEFELYDAQAAATTLLKAAGGLTEKVVHTGPDDTPIQMEHTHAFDELSDAALLARTAQAFNRAVEEGASRRSDDDDDTPED